MKQIVDFSPLIFAIEQRDDLIANGPIQEVIDFAKSYGIHQDYDKIASATMHVIEKIKARLIKDGIDPNTI